MRERKIYNLYTRQTIPWSLECDKNGLSRKEALDKIQNLEARKRVNFDGTDVSNFVHLMVAGYCQSLAALTFFAPTGPCICFYKKPPFIGLCPGMPCFFFLAIIQGVIAWISFDLIRE